MSTTLQQEPLSIVKALKWTVFLLAIVGGITLFFAWMNQIRGEQVIKKYDEHAKQFMDTNTQGLVDLFTVVMDACKTQYEKRPTDKNEMPLYGYNFECENARTQINLLDKSALPNFSSTAYVRLSDGKSEAIEASGNYHSQQLLSSGYFFQSWPEKNRNDLVAYLEQGKEINRWQDFIGMLPKKEVVTPLRKDNQIIGYIFQSVLER